MGTFFDETGEHDFQDLCYTNYFTLFCLHKFQQQDVGKSSFFLESHNNQGALIMQVIQCDPSQQHLSHLQSVHVSHGELFYLQSLLLSQPTTSWEDVQTVGNTVYPSFQATCILALGLFTDKDEAQVCMQEAINTLCTPYQLHILFIHLLTNMCIATPLKLWNGFQFKVTEDFVPTTPRDIEYSCNEALKQLKSLLQSCSKHLNNYGLLQPLTHDNEIQWQLHHWLPQAQILQRQVDAAMSVFNPEQQDIFLRVQHAILANEPLLMFIDGKASHSKTFLMNTLCDWVWSTRRIALPTATLAFAAQLYPGGQTVHSTFGVHPCQDHSALLVP